MAVAVKCCLPNRSSRRIGNEQCISVLVEGQACGHEPPRIQSVSGITRRWCHCYRPLRQQADITPYTADSISIEINCVRHRLDTEYLFTPLIRIGCVFTHTTPGAIFQTLSLTRQSAISPEVSFLIEGDAVASRTESLAISATAARAESLANSPVTGLNSPRPIASRRSAIMPRSRLAMLPLIATASVGPSVEKTRRQEQARGRDRLSRSFRRRRRPLPASARSAFQSAARARRLPLEWPWLPMRAGRRARPRRLVGWARLRGCAAAIGTRGARLSWKSTVLIAGRSRDRDRRETVVKPVSSAARL